MNTANIFRISTFLLLFPVSFQGLAAIFQVGPDQIYPHPNALYDANILSAGDTVLIDFGEYSGQDVLANWTQDNLLIQGVGGRPHLIADGAYILGKGIWVCSGNNITVENIEFSDAAVPDENGAGIRLDGIGLTLRHCYFHDNENGILTNNTGLGEILIEYCEFDSNGIDGFTHNLYIGHCERLIFQYNYSHHANFGHNLKSRAHENFILYNRIMDEETGFSSRLIDLSNGGFSIVMGNILMQGENAINNNCLGYGLEGTDPELDNELYVINNTFHNEREASCIFVDIVSTTENAIVSNNIFTGSGISVQGNTGTMEGNLVIEDPSSLGFLELAQYDYRLTANSPAVGNGSPVSDIQGYSLTPAYIYVHPADMATRIVDGTIDSGAYEYEVLSALPESIGFSFQIYPNPAADMLFIASENIGRSKLEVFDASGRIVHSKTISHLQAPIKLDISHLKQGLYVVKIQLDQGQVIASVIIKE